MKGHKELILPLAVIFLLALVIRLYPIAISPYPYNIDGLGEGMMANGIYDSGSLSVPPDAGYSQSYIVQMPLMDGLVAASSFFVGIEPLFLIQPVIAAVGALSCVAAALVVHRITGSRRICVLSGMFLAMLGTYVFCTTSAWKETLGLTLMIIIAGLYLERKDMRFRIMLTAVLFMMTFVHHHSAVITYLMFTFAVVAEGFLAARKKQWRWGNYADIATAVSLWILVLGYYSNIDLPYYLFLRPDTDLYLFIAVAVVMVLLMVVSMAGLKASLRRYHLKVLIPALAAGLMILNYFRPIFPGIAGTDPSLMIFVLCYIMLVVPMWLGSDRTLLPGQKATPLLYAVLFAPLSMILFGLLRALDPTSHMIVYRTFDFLDLGLAVLFGAGLVLMVKNLRRMAPVVTALFLVMLAITTPLAFQTEKLFGVQNQTYGYEVETYYLMDSISSLRTADSDQRIGTSMEWVVNFSGASDLAYRIEAERPFSNDKWLVVEDSWTTSGAQEFPLRPRVLNETVFDSFLERMNLLIISGPYGSQIIALISPDQS